MEKFPKSKLGASLAAAYLLLAAALFLVMFFGGGGLHGRAAGAFIILFFLTAPWSWLAAAAIQTTNGAPPNSDFESALIVVGAIGGALINAVAVYFTGWLAGVVLKSRVSKSEGGLK